MKFGLTRITNYFIGILWTAYKRKYGTTLKGEIVSLIITHGALNALTIVRNRILYTKQI